MDLIYYIIKTFIVSKIKIQIISIKKIVIIKKIIEKY